MAELIVLKNQVGLLDPLSDFRNTGWVISGGYATHFPCNPGTMRGLRAFGMVPGTSYKISYDVDQYVSDGVNIFLGTQAGDTVSAAGHVEQTIECVGTDIISFYSDGYLRISNLKVVDLVTNAALTLAFNEKAKQWDGGYSYAGEKYLKFSDDLFGFKDGVLWKFNSSEVYNNFFGVQYPSEITFYVNSEDAEVKIFHGMRIISNKRWFCPNDIDIKILPYEGKSLGMQSRLKKNKFVPLQGDFYADFLRNLLDPRFETTLEALRYGEELRGHVLAVTIRNFDNVEVRLTAVDVKYTPQNYTM